MRFRLNDLVICRDPNDNGRRTLHGLQLGRIVDINGIDGQLLSILVLKHNNPRCVGKVYKNYLARKFSVFRPFAPRDVSLSHNFVDIFVTDREEVA